jgi:hypothetical protein
MNRIVCRGWILGLFVAFAAEVSHGQEKGAGEPIVIGETMKLQSEQDELIPFLDGRYRTRPFRIFFSGFFGGGFAVYAFLTRPDSFNGYLAATPAVDYEGGSSLILDNARKWLAGRDRYGRCIYMGVEEEPQLAPVLERFVEILS